MPGMWNPDAEALIPNDDNLNPAAGNLNPDDGV